MQILIGMQRISSHRLKQTRAYNAVRLAGAARSALLTPPPFLILLYTPKRGRACNTLGVGKWQARVPAVSRRVPATHYARQNVCLQSDAVCLQHTMRDQTCACRLTPCACNTLCAIKRAPAIWRRVPATHYLWEIRTCQLRFTPTGMRL